MDDVSKPVAMCGYDTTVVPKNFDMVACCHSFSFKRGSVT